MQQNHKNLQQVINNDQNIHVKRSQSTQSMIDFYIVKNERKLSKDQKRYSLTQNTHSKCKSQSNPRDSRRIGTACTVYSSNNHSLTQRQFIHPWAMNVRSRSIRIKTDLNRRQSSFQLKKLGCSSDQITFDSKPIHSRRQKNSVIKYKNINLTQKININLSKLSNKKYFKYKNKKYRQQKQSKRQSLENAIEIITHRQASQKYNREILKKKIVNQRNQKQKAIQKIHKQKADIAFEQKIISYQLKSERKQIQDYQMYQKRLLYNKQQIFTYNRRLIKGNIKQYKKQSKLQLKTKWIHQFQMASSNQGIYITPRQKQFTNKMHKAIQILVNLTHNQ